MYKVLLIFCFFSNSLLLAESFIATPKKRQPKISAEQCSREILEQMKLFTISTHYISLIQAVELSWIEDMLDNAKNSFFKSATQHDLQLFIKQNEKLTVLAEQFVTELKSMHSLIVQMMIKK
jgi:hypothetical protein